jgi:hypothetical protein
VTEQKAIHKHAFWLYGVVVGLAIKSALETSVPHLINPSRLSRELYRAGELVPFDHTHISYPEIVRLGVFLALIIRFYFGSAFFFGEAYEGDNAEQEYPKKNYGLDFIFGFLHFCLFFVLALTIDIHTSPVYWFPVLVGVILVYDLFWYGFSFTQDTSSLIFWWTVVNLLTALAAGLVYVLISGGTQNPLRAELWALWLVAIVSIVDIGLMMIKKPFFEPITRISPRTKPLT